MVVWLQFADVKNHVAFQTRRPTPRPPAPPPWKPSWAYLVLCFPPRWENQTLPLTYVQANIRAASNISTSTSGLQFAFHNICVNCSVLVLHESITTGHILPFCSGYDKIQMEGERTRHEFGRVSGFYAVCTLQLPGRGFTSPVSSVREQPFVSNEGTP